MWSHHEKSVVIDQRICYLGGIDLCYGRFDNENYWLKEPVKGGSGLGLLETMFPGADFNNVRVKDFMASRFFEKSLIDTDAIPRMPWRDVQVKIEGEIAKDMGRNFIQYWSFIKNDFAAQKEAQVIGISNLKEQKRLTKKVSEMVRPGTVVKYQPKSTLMPAMQARNLFDDSLNDDSTLTKAHNKEPPKLIEEVMDEDKQEDRDTKQKARLFQSWQNNARVELEDLIQQVKEDKDDEDIIEEDVQQ